MKFSFKNIFNLFSRVFKRFNPKIYQYKKRPKNTARMRGVILQKAKPRLPLRYMRISEHYDA